MFAHNCLTMVASVCHRITRAAEFFFEKRDGAVTYTLKALADILDLDRRWLRTQATRLSAAAIAIGQTDRADIEILIAERMQVDPSRVTVHHYNEAERWDETPLKVRLAGEDDVTLLDMFNA